MASQAQLSIDEYLGTSYRPDREYIDGELRERNAGKWEHARLQALLAAYFADQESAWDVMVPQSSEPGSLLRVYGFLISSSSRRAINPMCLRLLLS